MKYLARAYISCCLAFRILLMIFTMDLPSNSVDSHCYTFCSGFKAWKLPTSEATKTRECEWELPWWVDPAYPRPVNICQWFSTRELQHARVPQEPPKDAMSLTPVALTPMPQGETAPLFGFQELKEAQMKNCCSRGIWLHYTIQAGAPLLL